MAQQQEALLRERLGGDIYTRSQFHRGRLDRAGLGRKGVRRTRDLERLAPMTLDDVRSPSTLLLQTRPEAHPPTGLAAKKPASRNTARRYWPVQWVTAGGVPMGYSADDLELLGDLGAQLLERAGARPADVLANLLTPGPDRDFWQITLGAQKAGISAAAFGPGQTPTDIDILTPTVLVGEAKELSRLFDAASASPGTLRHVHTAVVVGEQPTERQRHRLVKGLGGKESGIVWAWAPPGVMAMWAQCRGGVGLHTWPETEILELTDPVSGLGATVGAPGQVVWTGIGWYATAIVRLKTELFALRLYQRCPSCGRDAARVYPMAEALGFPLVLDLNPNVVGWVAELQKTVEGTDELIIWLALDDASASVEILQEVDAKIGPARVWLVDEAEVERRLENAHGEKFGDRRSLHVQPSLTASVEKERMTG